MLGAEVDYVLNNAMKTKVSQGVESIEEKVGLEFGFHL